MGQNVVAEKSNYLCPLRCVFNYRLYRTVSLCFSIVSPTTCPSSPFFVSPLQVFLLYYLWIYLLVFLDSTVCNLCMLSMYGWLSTCVSVYWWLGTCVIMFGWIVPVLVCVDDLVLELVCVDDSTPVLKNEIHFSPDVDLPLSQLCSLGVETSPNFHSTTKSHGDWLATTFWSSPPPKKTHRLNYSPIRSGLHGVLDAFRSSFMCLPKWGQFGISLDWTAAARGRVHSHEWHSATFLLALQWNHEGVQSEWLLRSGEWLEVGAWLAGSSKEVFWPLAADITG